MPGGKSLLVTATPNQVNVIAELGQLEVEQAAGDTSFLDILATKLNRS